MIVTLQALAPAALLGVGGCVLLLRPSTTIFLLVQAAALAALVRLSQLTTVALSVPLYEPLPGFPMEIRLDRLSLFFATTAAAAGLLVALAVVPRARLPLGWIALSQFGALTAILSGNLNALAAGAGMFSAAVLMLALAPQGLEGPLRRPSAVVGRSLVLLVAAVLLLLTGAVAVQALAGTAALAAVPVGAVDARTGSLLAAGPVMMLAGLGGLVRVCRRPPVIALLLSSAALPLAAYALARVFDVAEGRPLDPGVGLALAGAAAAGSLVLGLQALWATDLGAAISRLTAAGALLLVAAFGAGGSDGLAAFLVGFIALEVVSATAFVLVEAGGGRLPGTGMPSWLVGFLALLPLAAVGGALPGPPLDARVLEVHRLAADGVGGVVVAAVAVAAMIAMLAGAVATGRFGGGHVDGPRAAGQLVLAAGALVALALGASLLVDLSTSLAAAAGRAPLADVRSVAGSALPGPGLGAFLLVAALGLVAAAGATTRSYSPATGLRGSPDLLPPRLAVVPGILVPRVARAGIARLMPALEAVVSRPRAVIAVAWAVAVLGVALAVRS